MPPSQHTVSEQLVRSQRQTGSYRSARAVVAEADLEGSEPCGQRIPNEPIFEAQPRQNDTICTLSRAHHRATMARG
jgi:hypothetical protein